MSDGRPTGYLEICHSLHGRPAPILDFLYREDPKIVDYPHHWNISVSINAISYFFSGRIVRV